MPPRRRPALFRGVRFVLALSIILAGTSHAGTRPEEAGDEIIRRTEEYIASLQELSALYEEGARSAARAFEQRRVLYGSGLVSRQDFESSGRALEESRGRLEDVSNRIVESSILISEVRLAQELARGWEQKPSVKDVAVFHTGKAAWKLADISRIEDFYLKRFGVSLPVSALGQTALHTRMGFDHRDAADVALHPDSPEGLQLMEFLRTSGISFIAFREALPYSATGAHIHIGQPSARLTVAGAPPAAFTDRSGS